METIKNQPKSDLECCLNFIDWLGRQFVRIKEDYINILGELNVAISNFERGLNTSQDSFNNEKISLIEKKFKDINEEYEEHLQYHLEIEPNCVFHMDRIDIPQSELFSLEEQCFLLRTFLLIIIEYRARIRNRFCRIEKLRGQPANHHIIAAMRALKSESNNGQ